MTADNRATVPWWLAAMNDVCVLEFWVGQHVTEFATTFEGVEKGRDGRFSLCFRYNPDLLIPRMLPDTVRLIVATDDGTATYHLRVVAIQETLVYVAPEPLSVQTRRLRRFPRTPYHLGPCAAVVHGTNGQWRGVLEFWVWDVSEMGVGFKLEIGRAFLLGVGDTIRSPIMLPDGRRSWLDGSVAWLSPEGRGGLIARRAPVWLPVHIHLA